MIRMYDLAGADPHRRFSPYCWRTRMALAHKGLAVETVPWRFTDKAAIAFSGQGRVPVVQDGERTLCDSLAIAYDLEARYGDRPSLFGGVGGSALARFINNWADGVLHPALVRLIIADVWAIVAEQDRAYFRTSREARFGMPLEAVQADRGEAVVGFRKLLEPLRATLLAQPYLGGAAANYADYIVFGAFQWARVTSPFPLLETDDPIIGWRERLLDAFDGLARQVPAASAR
jgi:glutathione S-transferase